jgi:hypothetical protein
MREEKNKRARIIKDWCPMMLCSKIMILWDLITLELGIAHTKINI